MNIREKLREALNNRNKYGCVMLDLNIDDKIWGNLLNLVNEEDVYYGNEEDTGYGFEETPHITLLYGIHEDVPDKDVEDLISEIKSPEAELSKISSFTNKLFDVLKFDVESKDLGKLNKKFKELPHTSEYPNYHPHATICYCLPGKGEKYIKKLNNYLEENGKINISVDKIIYSKPDNTKKEYPFK